MLDPDAWCNISDHHYSRIIGFTKKGEKTGNLDGGLPKSSAPGSQLFSKRKSSGWQMDSALVVWWGQSHTGRLIENIRSYC